MKKQWEDIANRVKLGLPLTKEEMSIYILFIATEKEAKNMLCMMRQLI